MLRDLPIALIDTRQDARAVNETAVEALAESIAEVGLINPIRVRAVGERWEVIAGAHRLAACKSLGLADITAALVADDDLHAELAMIDENLCRAELTPSERAQHTARRKAIYLELHPETAHGANLEGAGVAKLSAPETPAFAAATAAATGQSERAVRRDAERGEKVFDGAFALIKGTALDTGVFLDKLKKLSPSEQMVVVKRELAWLKQQRKSGLARRIVKTADHPLNDEEAREKQVAALMAAWNKASKEAREEFLLRIETPVMDAAA
jgi:ParB-like chromosome segregation protein Spo0J